MKNYTKRVYVQAPIFRMHAMVEPPHELAVLVDERVIKMSRCLGDSVNLALAGQVETHYLSEFAKFQESFYDDIRAMQQSIASGGNGYRQAMHFNTLRTSREVSARNARKIVEITHECVAEFAGVRQIPYSQEFKDAQIDMQAFDKSAGFMQLHVAQLDAHLDVPEKLYRDARN